jgi:apolipoprotein N-acyltransferase
MSDSATPLMEPPVAPAPSALPTIAPTSPTWRTLVVPAAVSGGLLWLCHFPVAWGWLGWVALVPLLSLVRSPASGWRVALAGYVGGLAFFVPALKWMPAADPRMYLTWALMAAYCSLYVPLAIRLLCVLERRVRLPLVVGVPVVWTALEFLRAHFGSGFAWYFLGHTQHNWLPVIQVSDLAGAYAVTFLVAAVNALGFEALYRLPGWRQRLALSGRPVGRLRWQAAGVLVLLTACLNYGVLRLRQAAFTPGPRLALVQPSMPQGTRNGTESASEAARQAAAQSMGEDFARLNALAVSLRPDLIVFPETSHPEEWAELAAEYPADWRAHNLVRWNGPMMADVRAGRIATLLGLNRSVMRIEGDHVRREARYNSALLLDAEGRPAGLYDKMHRVPMGEYVPLRDAIPFLKNFAPYDFDYEVRKGEAFTHFTLGESRFGVVICFEDTDPELPREYVKPEGEGPVDFLLNISNDGWFDGTEEHEEHLAISRFRAVECRRSLCRAVNMGISAVIDGDGRVLRPDVVGPAADGPQSQGHVWEVSENASLSELPVGRWKEFKKVPGAVLARVPLDHRTSLYARWGDWLPWTCWLTLGTLLAWALVRRTNATGIVACP